MTSTFNYTRGREVNEDEGDEEYDRWVEDQLMEREMSLVPTFVESQEGRWYKNPVIHGEGWFVCWDDEEPIELVAQRDTPLKDVLYYLREEGWSIRTHGTARKCGSRYFLKEGASPTRGISEDHGLRKAHRVFLKQSGGPPDSLLDEFYEVDEPTGDRVTYYNE